MAQKVFSTLRPKDFGFYIKKINFRIIKSLSLLSLAAAAAAQQSAWGQCGGTGYARATTCVSGYICQYSNPYYSQCVPGTASAGSGTTLVTSVAGAASTITSATTVAAGSISKASGTKFTIEGIAFLTNNADVDTVISHLQSSSLKILRVWGFNDVTSIPGSSTVYFQYFSGSGATINTRANGLQHLNYVVQIAAAHGIKLIINFVNNWTDYGGMAAYMHSCGGSSNPDWLAISKYKSSACQSLYQTYIKAVVSRYTNSPAIFAWELANEPRCNGYNTAYIKSLDPNHMVCIGDEGFGVSGGGGSYPYTSGEGWNWNTNLAISTIDFGTFHLYPSSWGQTNDWGTAWITNHAAACVSAGKPCLFEEYGVTSSHCSVESSWQSTSLKTSGMGADLFWDEGDTLSSRKTSDDGNTIFYGTSDWTCLVTNHISAIG